MLRPPALAMLTHGSRATHFIHQARSPPRHARHSPRGTQNARTVACDEVLLAGRQVGGRLLGIAALPGPGGARVHQVVSRLQELLRRQLLQAWIAFAGRQQRSGGGSSGGAAAALAVALRC